MEEHGIDSNLKGVFVMCEENGVAEISVTVLVGTTNAIALHCNREIQRRDTKDLVVYMVCVILLEWGNVEVVFCCC